MAGMNGVVFVGQSAAGRRILAAGLAFERRQLARTASQSPAQSTVSPAPPPPDPWVAVDPLPVVMPLTGIERVKFDALAQRIQAALNSPDTEEPKPPLTLATIIGAVAVMFGMDPKLLTGHSRRHVYIVPRHLAYLLCHELTGHSFPMIARMFRGRDHSTIIYGIKATRERMKDDPNLARQYADLKATLEAAR